MQKKYHVLIFGAGSYVGESFKEYVEEHYKENFIIDTLDARGFKPEIDKFKGYDSLFLVAGIVHRRETVRNAHLYYEVNRDLTVSVAKSAKAAGVGQIVVMSTIAVYGKNVGTIKKHTKPTPTNHYGKSKLQAERRICRMRDKNFKVVILRPPMIYGKGCKGNYQRLRALALHMPIFPKVENQRSMIYIGNLCQFVVEIIRDGRNGLFFPQNEDYVNTGSMVKAVASAHGKKIKAVPGFQWICHLPINVFQKAFGSLTYEKMDTIKKFCFEESIRLIELK